MKILFIQLPLTDNSRGYINGNIQYAPALLGGYIEKNFDNIKCETLPPVLTDFCSNEVIIRYVLSLEPDLLCFTSYLWNIERNLNIARVIRDNNPEIKIVFGGPEIAPGSVAFHQENSFVDMFVTGEGEWFFKNYLSGKKIPVQYFSGNPVAVQPVNELVSPDEIIEPLTGRRLNSMNDGSVFIELTRGCPYRCSYCYYSRNSKKVRELQFDLLLDAIRNDPALSEIYILSPTFDRSLHFRDNLEKLKMLNHNVSLHTEIRADRIDSETAGLMYDSGFRSLEVGLQSMNKRALESVHRSSDPERELEGMACLAEAGIELKIGIIPGLPGDDPESFMNTVDVLCSRGFSESIELYPLMILPGTEIRELAEEQQVSFLRKPPYFYHEGWGFTHEDIRHVTSLVEEITGYSQSIEFLPDFTVSENPLFTGGLRGEDKSDELWDIGYINEHVHTSVVDIHVEYTGINIIPRLSNLLEGVCRDRFFNIIIHSDLVPDYESLYLLLEEKEEDNFHRRLNIYNSFMDGSVFKFFHVTENLATFHELIDIGDFVTPLIRISKDSALLPEVFSDLPDQNPALLIGRGSYGAVRDFLCEMYSQAPFLVAFEWEPEMQQFYSDTGLDYISLPYNFGIIEV